MNTVLVDEDFAKVFCGLLKKADTTCYKIANFAHLDQGYLSRLKNGEKGNPSIQTLLGISFGLVHCSDSIDMNDIERLFNSAGKYFPTKH